MATARVVPHDPKNTSSDLWATLPVGDKPAKVGTTHVFYHSPEELTTLTSLGGDFSKESGNVKRETVRKAVGSAVKAVRGIDGVKNVKIDASQDAHASGALMR